MIHVKQIPAELTYDIRHLVLRDGLPRESCYWDTDKNEGVFHLGAWIGGYQVGTATFQPERDPDYPEHDSYRLRGMAVLPESRGEGAGGLLLLTGEDRVRQMGINHIWCHARTGAISFYEKYGWEKSGEIFEIPTAGLHYIMRKDLSKPFGCKA